VSVATDPGLLADYQAGRITYADYQAAMQSQQRASELAAKERALQGATGVDPQLIASEIALARAGAAQAAREAEQRRAAERAAQRARDAAERARIQQEAEARIRRERERANELAEQALRERRAETGRVRAPEEEGAIIAAAIEYAQAESDYAAGQREEPLPDFVSGQDGKVGANGDTIQAPTPTPVEPAEIGYVYIDGQKVPRPETWVEGRPFGDPIPPEGYLYEPTTEQFIEQGLAEYRKDWIMSQFPEGGGYFDWVLGGGGPKLSADMTTAEMQAAINAYFSAVDAAYIAELYPEGPYDTNGGPRPPLVGLEPDGTDGGPRPPLVGLEPDGTDGGPRPPLVGMEPNGTNGASGGDTPPDVIPGGLSLERTGKQLLLGAAIAIIFGIWILD